MLESENQYVGPVFGFFCDRAERNISFFYFPVFHFKRISLLHNHPKRQDLPGLRCRRPKRICAARGEGLLVLMGNTLGTLERNVLSLMRELWGPDLVGVIRTSAAGNVVQLFGKKVYVLGADNKKHIAAFRARPLSTPTGTRSPHGTRACSRC